MKGDALALVKALRGFGVPESVLEQVQASLVPPKRDPGNAREKALSDCKAQLHILRQRVVKQRTAVSNAQEALDRSKEKLSGLEDEVAKLELRYREVSVDPLTPSSSKVASEVADGPHLAEVQSCTDGMYLTGQDGDLDPPDPRLAVHPRGQIVFPLPLRLRRLCKTKMLPSGVVLQRHSRMIPCSMLLRMGNRLNKTVHSLLLGCVDLYGMDVPANCVPLESEGPMFPDHGNRTKVFDPCESGWVLVQRRRQRCSQGQRKKGKESEVQKASFVF